MPETLENELEGVDEAMGLVDDEANGKPETPAETPDEQPQEVAEESAETQKPAKQEEEPNYIDDAVVQRARQAGYQDDEIEAIGEERLSALMDSAEAARNQAILNEVRARQEAPDPASPATKTEPKIEDIEPLELTFGEYDSEETQNAVRAVASHYDKHVAKLNQELAAVQEYVHQQQSTEFYSKVDDYISGLGEDYRELFGESEVRNDPNSPAGKNVDKFVKAVFDFGQVNPNATYDELFSRALSAEFHDFQSKLGESSARKELQSKVKKAKRGSVRRPTKRKTAPELEDPMDVAQKKFEQRLADKGFTGTLPPAANVDDLFE